jgi:hypothetical protein
MEMDGLLYCIGLYIYTHMEKENVELFMTSEKWR